MSKLSVVIITLNEEKQIGQCIDSVIGIADEVIVLDSFSTDRTEVICREKGAVFHQHSFDDYVAQKNRAMGLATHNLVLSIDADEVLSEELMRSIAKVKQAPSAAGYTMNRLTNYCGQWIRHCGWYPDRKLRLADRASARWEGESIHEKLVVQGKTLHLDGDLLHYSYNTIKSHENQANNFTEISARSMFERGKKAPLWRLVFHPLVMFIKCYFIKIGFLDGFYGLTISLISAHATFLKYAKLRQLWMFESSDPKN